MTISLLYSYISLNGWVGVVALKCKVFVLERKYVLNCWVNFHYWKRLWLTPQLFFCLHYLVLVKMRVAKRMNEISCFVSAYLRDHHCQKSITSNVKRNSKEEIATSLIEHAIKDRKSTRLNSSHVEISYAVFCL